MEDAQHHQDPHSKSKLHQKATEKGAKVTKRTEISLQSPHLQSNNRLPTHLHSSRYPSHTRISHQPSPSTRSPFTADATEDAAIFDKPHKISTYRVIMVLQISGDFLSPSQNFVEKKGGGVVAVHCASCGHPDSEWYSNLMGGVFPTTLFRKPAP